LTLSGLKTKEIDAAPHPKRHESPITPLRKLQNSHQEYYLGYYKPNVETLLSFAMFTSVTLHYSPKYYSGDQIEKNEMSGACRMYGVRRGVYRVLVGGT